MKTIKSFKNYSGIDSSNEISLFEYGLLVRYNKKDNDFHCIYRVNENLFDWGYISESDLNNLINGKDWMNESDINSFLSYVGMDNNQWIDESFVNKLYNLLSYYGYENIFGSAYHSFKISE